MTCEPTPNKKNVLCPRDIRNINGKLRSLETLKNMPRASLPEMQYFVAQIEESFQFLLSYARAPSTKASRALVETTQRELIKLENLAIRVILQEQSLEVACAELSEQMP